VIAVAVLASYLLGGVPFALIAGRWKGIDLRTHGSGNLGATNAIRVLGKGLGIPVLLLDLLKGVGAAAVLPMFFGPFEEPGRLVCGAAAVAGHVFSPFLRFRGGKGVATAGGAFLALAPAATGIVFLVFLVALLIGRFVSLASVLAAVALPMALGSLGASRLMLGAGIVIAGLVVFRHRQNLSRLRAGTESRIGGRREGS
jgi:glycerol-3-phosphate acyltransferase PlsY